MPSIGNKVVLITGASSGIGEGTARVLAEHGARVVLGARRTDRLKSLVNEIERAGGFARYRALDVVNLDDVKAFVEFAESEFGGIDVLVNNAGVMPLSPLSALKVDEWNWMIDVNIRGVCTGSPPYCRGWRRRVTAILSMCRRSAASSRSRPALSIRRPSSQFAPSRRG